MKKLKIGNFYALFIILIFACQDKSFKQNIFISVRNLSYNDLDSIQKVNIPRDEACCYLTNWNNPSNCIKKEKAYYLDVQINNEVLSTIQGNYKNIPKNKLLEENPDRLYGKYYNKWKVLNENGTEICQSSKCCGHNYFSISRKDSIDHMIIGPLREKPKTLIITIWDSDNNENNKFRQFEIK